MEFVDKKMYEEKNEYKKNNEAGNEKKYCFYFIYHFDN